MPRCVAASSDKQGWRSHRGRPAACGSGGSKDTPTRHGSPRSAAVPRREMAGVGSASSSCESSASSLHRSASVSCRLMLKTDLKKQQHRLTLESGRLPGQGAWQIAALGDKPLCSSALIASTCHMHGCAVETTTPNNRR